MSLKEYNKKRNFSDTTEPEGKTERPKDSLRFVIQRHAATRLHYDFRLEFSSVLKSWAVPKGPSLNPNDKRLAMHVEDHPLSYRTFEGRIPDGNYGAGQVEIWDQGTYEPETKIEGKTDDEILQQQYAEGSIKIIMHGKKLRGGFALVKMNSAKEKNAWLLVKHNDQYSVSSYNAEDQTDPESLVTAYIREKKSAKNKNKSGSKKKAKRYGPTINHGNKLKEFIHPMLATSRERPFDSDEWIFEIKWDGYRAIADLKDQVKLYSRNGLLFTNGFLPIIEALKQQLHTMVLDGEIVAYDADGQPSFQALQNSASTPAFINYQVFDLLWLNGHSTMTLPIEQRKELLKEALQESEQIRYHDHVDATGKAFFEQVVKLGLEGVIAKKKTSTYQQGIRSENWLKIKHVLYGEVIIAGYTAPKRGREKFGSLIIGEWVGDELVFRGHVGTGFTNDSLHFVAEKMKPLEQATCPFSEIPATNEKPTWVKPELKAKIKFTEQTNEGSYRHPVFVGLAIEPQFEQDIEKKEAVALVKESLPFPLSNPDKVFWPESGITKKQLAVYYQQIQQYILPHLQNRPQSMNRFPDGITGINFYQKDVPDHALKDVQTTRIYSNSTARYIDYLLCNDAKTMAYMNNLGCIDFNVWPSTVFHLDHPDYLMLDIDPSDENSFSDVVEVALAIYSLLKELNITGYCKTSGSTGIHIFLPLEAKYTFHQAKDFALLLMQRVHAMLPDLTTLERSVKARPKKRVYLDYLQNRRGQTLASVYSVRPKPGATVSMPIKWSELNARLHPSQFNIFNAIERLEQNGDLFSGVLGKGIDMLQAIEKLA